MDVASRALAIAQFLLQILAFTTSPLETILTYMPTWHPVVRRRSTKRTKICLWKSFKSPNCRSIWLSTSSASQRTLFSRRRIPQSSISPCGMVPLHFLCAAIAFCCLCVCLAVCSIGKLCIVNSSRMLHFEAIMMMHAARCMSKRDALSSVQC